MLTAHFSQAIKATQPRVVENADNPPESSHRIRVFAKAASGPPLPDGESEYLRFLSYCATTYERMDDLADRLAALDRLAGRALRLLETRARDRQDQIENLREAATVIRYGQRVYIARDGSGGFHENGDPMTRREFELTKWGRRSAAWEDYRRATTVLQAALVEHGDVLGYRERIGFHRRRLLQDEPLSAALLQELERDLDRMPDAVRQQVPGRGTAPRSAAREYTDHDGFTDAPAARAAFNHAALGAIIRARGSGRAGLGPPPPRRNSSPGQER